MLAKVIAEKWLTANAVIGFYPANTLNDDDIEIYTDDTRKKVKTVFHSLRQQTKKPEGQENNALEALIAPKETGKADYIRICCTQVLVLKSGLRNLKVSMTIIAV